MIVAAGLGGMAIGVMLDQVFRQRPSVAVVLIALLIAAVAVLTIFDLLEIDLLGGDLDEG